MMALGTSAVSTGHYVMSLDDQVTRLRDFEGGNIEGEVETFDRGPQQTALKHISTIRFEPFTIGIGLSMGAPLIDWITTSLDLAHTRKDGVIVATNEEGKAQSYCHFKNTLIEEITIPTLDAASRAPAYLKIRFQPEEISYGKGDGVVFAAGADLSQKQWLAGNFRLRLGDLPCQRVSKIDAFTIRQRIVESNIGQLRSGPTKEPINVEYPNIKVTFAGVDLAAWQDFFSRFVIGGQNDQANELHGALEFLDPKLQQVIGSVAFSQVGIFSLKPAGSNAGGEGSPSYVAELYVEKMTLNLANASEA
jgi:hypothetical protein